MNYILLFSFMACNKQGDASSSTTSAPAAEKAKPVEAEDSKAATETATQVPAETVDILLQEVGFATPESVFYDKKNDRYLVSNINGNPTDADDNGFISIVSVDGKVENLKWIDGTAENIQLSAPKGMAVLIWLDFAAL